MEEYLRVSRLRSLKPISGGPLHKIELVGEGKINLIDVITLLTDERQVLYQWDFLSINIDESSIESIMVYGACKINDKHAMYSLKFTTDTFDFVEKKIEYVTDVVGSILDKIFFVQYPRLSVSYPGAMQDPDKSAGHGIAGWKSYKPRRSAYYAPPIVTWWRPGVDNIVFFCAII